LLIGSLALNIYSARKIDELKTKAEIAETVLRNNFLASQDSLRKIIDDGRVQYEKLAFSYELATKREKELSERLKNQGYQLAVIQDLKLQLSQLKLKLAEGDTYIDTLVARYSFPPKDTAFVTISGETEIFLKKPEKSYTNLNIQFKPIEGKSKIAFNPDTKQVTGVFEPLSPALEVITLETEIDPRFFLNTPPPESFWDKLKIGGFVSAQTAFGLHLHYERFGVWGGLINEKGIYGISIIFNGE